MDQEEMETLEDPERWDWMDLLERMEHPVHPERREWMLNSQCLARVFVVPLETSEWAEKRETREPLDPLDPKELSDRRDRRENREQEESLDVPESLERAVVKEMMPSIVPVPRETEKREDHRRKEEREEEEHLVPLPLLIREVMPLVPLTLEELEDTREDKDMLPPLMERSNPRGLLLISIVILISNTSGSARVQSV